MSDQVTLDLESAPVVSIVMPCFNAGQFLCEAIDSVLAQDFLSFELLICDDHSTDNSVSIIEHYCALDGRVKLLTNKYEKGAGGARHTCFDESRGEYIAFLDADDTWYSSKLSQHLSFIAENQYEFSCSFYTAMNADNESVNVVASPRKITRRLMNYANFIGCTSVVCHRKLFTDIEFPKIKKRNDFCLWLELFERNPGIVAYCYPKSLSCYRVSTTGLSGSRIDALRYFYASLREHGGIGPVMAGWYSLNYLLLVGVKKMIPKGYNFVVRKL